MAEEQGNETVRATRLWSCYFAPADDGLSQGSIMLCEVAGDEILSISLRVAADAMTAPKRGDTA